MTIAQVKTICNMGIPFANKVTNQNSKQLTHVTSDNKESLYLLPDYFLSSSSNSYHRKHNNSTQTRISRIVSASLLSAMILTAAVDAKAQPSIEVKEVTVQSPKKDNEHTSRWLKFKNPLSHLSNILGFSSSATSTIKEQEKPITIEELQDLYNNDPEALDNHSLNNESLIQDNSSLLSRNSIYFTPNDNLETIQEAEDKYIKPLDTISIASSGTQYDEPWQDIDGEMGEALASEFASPEQIIPSAPLEDEMQTPSSYNDAYFSYALSNDYSQNNNYTPSVPSYEDLPLPSAPSEEEITEIEKEAIEILDRVLEEDSAFETLSDDTISDTSSEHSLSHRSGSVEDIAAHQHATTLTGESDKYAVSFDLPSRSNSPDLPNQDMTAEIGGVSITFPNHLFTVNKEDTSSLSNFSENDAEWEDEWSDPVIEEQRAEIVEEAKPVAVEQVLEQVTEAIIPQDTNQNTDSGNTATTTQQVNQDLPKIVRYQPKELLIPNNHYKAKPSSAEILEALAVKDEMYKTLSRRREAIEIEEDEIIDEEDNTNANNQEADATYSKLSAAEEARQTISRRKSAIAEHKALLEAKYATIAKARVGQSEEILPVSESVSESAAMMTIPDTNSLLNNNNNHDDDNNDNYNLDDLPPPPTDEALALIDMDIISDTTGSISMPIDYEVLENEQEQLPVPPYPAIEVTNTDNIYDDDITDMLSLPPTAEELKEMGIISEIIENVDEDLTFPPPPTKEELAEFDKLVEVSNPDQTLEKSEESISSEVQEESEYLSYSNILDQETAVDDDTQDSTTEADASSSKEPYVQDTSIDKEELLKKATAASISHNQVRAASKVASKQIRHRMFVRDMLTAAVAAGDEESDAPGNNAIYSIWSSGTFGSSKQKSQLNANGYSSRMQGGSIGADINFENDLILGASFSKISSSVKHQNQEEYARPQNQGKNNQSKHSTYLLSLYGSSPLKDNMSMQVIGSAGLSNHHKAIHANNAKTAADNEKTKVTPRTKLFSFESHLNYRIDLPWEITLIPNIGVRYEYDKSNSYQEQITKDHTIERSKKSYQALSTEIGSRVIFAPIKSSGSSASSFAITPTAHFSVERRIGSRGKSNPFTLTYQELGETIGSGNISSKYQNEKTSLNAGFGIIASRKNIKLELLYDLQRQKRFKSHQGLFKLKVHL